jgi:hypothetical protein
MLRAGKWLFVLIAVALVCGAQVSASVQSDKMIGMVVGRTGSVLHIGVPQPVREGTIFEVKPFEGEPPIAEARVISCTQERPFMALAKVIRGDTLMSVPTGVHAYADVDSVEGPDAPQPVVTRADDPDRNRFSIQAGAFYPVDESVREATADYWQSYRLCYTFIRAGRFETVLSGEYSKASGQAIVDGFSLGRTTEVIPVTVTGRLKPVSMGRCHLFMGVGFGMYNILTSDSAGIGTIKTNSREFGQELSTGVESSHGWVVELRYRNIQNSDLNGYLFTIGSRF